MDVISKGHFEDHINDFTGNHKYDDSDNHSDIVTTPLEKTEQILFELSSSQRLMILFKLKELAAGVGASKARGGKEKATSSSSLSSISKNLDLLVQEVHRNTNRLIDSGLITKDSNGNFFLTAFGDMVLNQLSTLSFLAENKSYFLDHKLGDLPLKFVQRTGALKNSTLLDNGVAVFEHQKELFKNTEEYLNIIVSEIPSYLIDLLNQIIEKKIRVNYMIPRNAILPRKRHNESKHEQYHDLLKKDVIQRRMIDYMNVGLIMNETEAIIQFPKGSTIPKLNQQQQQQQRQRQPIDTNSAYYSRDIDFHEWCSDYFDYKWQSSNTFDPKKLLEV